MELFFVVVIALSIGALLRYLVTGRSAYGILLTPAVSGTVTAIVWVAMLWLGFSFDGGWIWLISLVAGGLAALATAILVPRRRSVSDENRYAQLSGAR